MRLADGTLWPIPILLDVTPQSWPRRSRVGGMLALRDPEGVMLAALHVEELWEPDREASAQATFGTTSADHPGVALAPQFRQEACCSAAPPFPLVRSPSALHARFASHRATPAETRQVFPREKGWKTSGRVPDPQPGPPRSPGVLRSAPLRR